MYVCVCILYMINNNPWKIQIYSEKAKNISVRVSKQINKIII